METTVRLSKLALSGAAIAFSATLVAILAGFGSRLGVWPFATGFMFLKWSAILALAGLALSLAALYFTVVRKQIRGTALALTGVIVAIFTVTPPLIWLDRARSLPMIHDISTDTANPPRFETVLPLRRDAVNTTEYGGPNIARQQHQAYPNIEPALIPRKFQDVFDAALIVARNMGWHIISSDSGTGRIEATDTTFWFGFTDDVVIRITAQESTTRVDMRSLSRVGRSDVGTNARRITDYLRALRSELQ